jgi:hypothetical protein
MRDGRFNKERHIRHCALFVFRLKKNVADAAEVIFYSLGESGARATCRNAGINK